MENIRKGGKVTPDQTQDLEESPDEVKRGRRRGRRRRGRRKRGRRRKKKEKLKEI